MNKFIKFLYWVIFALLIVIGVLCYQLSESAFHNYLIFLVPMALVRMLHSVLLIKSFKKQEDGL